MLPANCKTFRPHILNPQANQCDQQNRLLVGVEATTVRCKGDTRAASRMTYVTGCCDLSGHVDLEMTFKPQSTKMKCFRG